MTDLIESLLEQLSLRTHVFHRGKHCGNWQLDLEHSEKALLHFVSEGNCVLELPEQQLNIELAQGDLVLLPRPAQHVLRASNLEKDENKIPGGSSAQELPNNRPSGLVCAYVEFDSNAHNPLLDALPDYVITRSDSHHDVTWLENLLGLLFAEAGSETTASHTVIERLTNILFIHIIRVYISNYPADTGVFAAYNDPSLCKVLELIHEHPQKPWSIADFSAAANLSRSAFIEKFSRTLKIPPMTYLMEQRLEFGCRQLSEGKGKVLDVALDCGYENESSFSKAFKRMYHINPGEFRLSVAKTRNTHVSRNL